MNYSTTTSSAPPRNAITGLPGDLGTHVGGRRHLSWQVCRLVLGARRGLLRRGRDRARRRQAAAPARQCTPVEWVEEDSYFFRLSAFSRPACLDSTKRIPISSAPRAGATRSSASSNRGLQRSLGLSHQFRLGRSGARDPKHVMYVWLDALTNYITEVGYPDESGIRCGNSGRPTCTWSARISFASIACFCPAFLLAPARAARAVSSRMAGGPTKEKISKSLGNVIEPKALVETYGVDAAALFPAARGAVRTMTAISQEARPDRPHQRRSRQRPRQSRQRVLSIVRRTARKVLPPRGR